MVKICDKCNKEMRGFGTTCAECRKTKGRTSSTVTPSGDNCAVCGKVAYAMEKVSVEGAIFHATCFKCSHCNNKLSPTAFSKSNDGRYFCKTHYQQLFKVKGRYSFSLPADGNAQEEAERNANTALATNTVELEQKRRVEELAKAEEDAIVEKENAKQAAKRVVDEEQARRFVELAKADETAIMEQEQAKEAAKQAEDEEQARRFVELAKADEVATMEQEKAKEAAKQAEDEEQARRVAEIEEADTEILMQRTKSQKEAIKAIDAEQEERISEHGTKPRKSLGSISVDELQSKAGELSPTSCKQAPDAAV